MFSSLMFAPVCRFITERAGSGSKARVLRSARNGAGSGRPVGLTRTFPDCSGPREPQLPERLSSPQDEDDHGSGPLHDIGVPASTLGEAHEIIGRMTRLGFPRDRMNVTPHEDDTFHV